MAHIELGNDEPGIRGLLAYRPETGALLSQLPGGAEQVAQTLGGAADQAPVTDKLRALLEIAALVRVDGRLVSAEAVATARAEGATDREIHDTVLLAATFCLFNRYVDGLGTDVPDDPADYARGAARLVEYGYVMPR